MEDLVRMELQKAKRNMDEAERQIRSSGKLEESRVQIEKATEMEFPMIATERITAMEAVGIGMEGKDIKTKMEIEKAAGTSMRETLDELRERMEKEKVLPSQDPAYVAGCIRAEIDRNGPLSPIELLVSIYKINPTLDAPIDDLSRKILLELGIEPRWRHPYKYIDLDFTDGTRTVVDVEYYRRRIRG